MTDAVPPDPVAHVPWRSRTVQVVLLSTLLATLGVPLVAPGLPVYRDVFGVSDAAASYLVSAYFVVGVFASPVVGIVADRVGRKRVLVASLLTFAVTGSAAAFGAGLGFSMPAVDAAISDLDAGRYQAEAISFRNSTTFLGRATGPVVFTGLAGAIGGYRPLLLVSGGVAVGLAVVGERGAGARRLLLRRQVTAAREGGRRRGGVGGLVACAPTKANTEVATRQLGVGSTRSRPLILVSNGDRLRLSKTTEE